MRFPYKIIFIFLILCNSVSQAASNEIESQIKKNHIEDIFIWKISDELKLSAKEEKQFTEINKNLNKKKAELNKKILDSIQRVSSDGSEKSLSEHRRLLAEYGQITLNEFDQVKKLLGTKKFVEYLKIKYELTTKVKSILIGEKPTQKVETDKKLPPPKVIIEKND